MDDRRMDEDSVHANQQPVLCATGCGFYGNPLNMNLCSKCFRDMESQGKAPEPAPSLVLPVMDKPAAVAREPSPEKAAEAAEDVVMEAAPTEAPVEAVAAAAEEGGEERPVQKNTSRCFSCNKRVGLTGFKCRCGYVYCSSHRYSDKHECSFDYKSAGRDAIAKANPTVVAAKVDKI